MSKIHFSRPNIGSAEIFSAAARLNSRQLAQGERVLMFEKMFSDSQGFSHGVAVNSGTSALHLSLLASGIGSGDEVLVPGISFAATANAVLLTGAKPVFVDIEPDTYHISLSDAQKKINSRTRAVIPVDIFGLPVDRKKLSDFCLLNSLSLLIDSAQSHGTGTRGISEKVDLIGLAYSFYATKNITTGEGGMLLTNSSIVDRSMRLLRNQGMAETYKYERAGFNNRMTDFQAAMGLVQVKKLAKISKRRRRIAEIYDEELVDFNKQVRWTSEESVFHQYTIRIPSIRDSVHEGLRNIGVPTRIFYPQALNKLDHLVDSVVLPNAEQYVSECLSLPIGPHLRDREVRFIARKTREFFEDQW